MSIYILMHMHISEQPENTLMCTFRHPTFWCTGHNILLLYLDRALGPPGVQIALLLLG